MRILVLHNYYQNPGGEDKVFEAEVALLEAAGHEVVRFVRRNAELEGRGALSCLVSACWNRQVVDELRRLIVRWRPDVAHVHNVFAVLSPAVYRVLHNAGIPVVQTLHNYRFICPGAKLLRNGKFCNLCSCRRIAWPAVVHRCYQNRIGSSLGMVVVLALHRLFRTWDRQIDLYLAPSDFVRRQMLAAGFPESRCVVRPHFTDDPGRGGDGLGVYAVYVGRLEQEKGLIPLIQAWRSLPNYPLYLIGDGPLRAELEVLIKEPGLNHVQITGWLAHAEVCERVGGAGLLVVPSICPESFGLTVIEAMARGVPVLASRVGALPEMVRDGVTGLLVEPGNVAELATAARRLMIDCSLRKNMARHAREHYEARFTPERGYASLIGAYQLASEIHSQSKG